MFLWIFIVPKKLTNTVGLSFGWRRILTFVIWKDGTCDLQIRILVYVQTFLKKLQVFYTLEWGDTRYDYVSECGGLFLVKIEGLYYVVYSHADPQCSFSCVPPKCLAFYYVLVLVVYVIGLI